MSRFIACAGSEAQRRAMDVRVVPFGKAPTEALRPSAQQRRNNARWHGEQRHLARVQDAAHLVAAHCARPALSPLRVPLHETTDTFARMEMSHTIAADL